jgi:hypothetical protein
MIFHRNPEAIQEGIFHEFLRYVTFIKSNLSYCRSDLSYDGYRSIEVLSGLL